ncbi:MAG: MBL fold metallo-hydrolase, partial [Deltaproteobacteria bacterium]|nr:MBL fold metallo-hydrolase [Deltaproteobacteria bacterium]
MRIKFWGTRGSIPVPGKDTTIYGGNTTCVEVTLQSGRTVIIDAGTGIRPLGEKLVADNNNAEI